MSNRNLPLLIAAIFLLLSFCAAAKAPATRNANLPLQKELATKQLKQFGQQSALLFIENKGQIVDQHGKHRKDIDFKLAGNSLNVFIGKGQIHYQFADVKEEHTKMYRLDVELIGADKNVKPVISEAQEYYENYYLAQCPDGAVAQSCKKISYKNIYPNIDWVLYAKEGKLKYDFVVHEGGDVSKIKLRYDGASSLFLVNGNITAVTPFGNITEQAPYSYNAISKKTVPSSFVLKNDIVAFNVEANCRELIIDPTLIWHTNFATTSHSYTTVKLDNADNIYQGGWIDASNNIATLGAHQTSYGGSMSDGYLAKYSSLGSIIWATYYGGSDTDEISSITVDASNNVIIAGYTNSNSAIASSGAQQTAFGGGYNDCFIAKFTTSGTRVWGTYYGGNDEDGLSQLGDGWCHIACDANNNVYLAGTTRSINAIATSGSYQSSNTISPALSSGFLAKFSSSGIRQWGTYYGGGITAINIDNLGYIYTGGFSNYVTGLATSGAFQTNMAWAILAKFDGQGTRIFGTYLGAIGNGGSYVTSMRNDKAGFFYVTGYFQTQSLITKGLSTLGPTLIKFSNTGSLVWGTRVFATRTNDITLDSFGNVYLTGNTGYNAVANIMTTPCTYQRVSVQQDNAFITIYDSSGICLWGTDYRPPNTVTYGSAIETNNSSIFLGGVQSYTSSSNSFLAKFSLDTFVSIGHPYFDTLRCQGDTFTVAYGVLYNFKPGNSFTVQLSDANGSFASPTNIGSTNSSSGGIITCVIPANTAYGTGYRIRIVATNPYKISCDDGYNISIGTQLPAKPVSSNNGPVCRKNTLHLYTSSSTSGVYYKWIGPNNYTSSQQNPSITNTTMLNSGSYIAQAFLLGCHRDDTTIVVIKPLPDSTNVSANTPICAGDTLKITNSDTSSGITYSWTGPNSFTSTSKNFFIANAGANASGNYIVTATLNGCTFKDTAAAVVNIVPVKPVITTNTPLCEGDSLRLNSVSTTPGVSYSWTGQNGFTSSIKDTGIGNAVVGQSGDYIVTATLLNCSSKDTETVLIKPNPQNVTAASNTPVCPGTTLNLTGGSSTSGVSWSWSGPSSYSATTQNASRNNMQTAWAGTYTVTATLNGCSIFANTAVASYITTPTPTVSANNPVCIGGVLNLTASTIPGAVYVWSGPNNYHSNAQNPTKSNMNIADAGVYSVNANVNGCISQTAVTPSITLVSGPSVSAYASPSSTICTGASVALVAVPNNIGTNPATYQWYQNSTAVTGATTMSYISPAPANGDVFYVQMTAGTACNSAVSSNNVTITTTPTTPPPAATIAASPGTDIWPGLNVNFSISSLTNGGSTPSYQWRLNGKDITGATTNKWNSTTLKDGESVCLWVSSSDQCASPKSTLSNCLSMKVAAGITSPLQGDLGVSIYPNPVSKELIIEGAAAGTSIQVNNIIGQTVYRGVIQSSKETINTSQWLSGAYLLHLIERDGSRAVRKVTK